VGFGDPAVRWEDDELTAPAIQDGPEPDCLAEAFGDPDGNCARLDAGQELAGIHDREQAGQHRAGSGSRIGWFMSLVLSVGAVMTMGPLAFLRGGPQG